MGADIHSRVEVKEAGTWRLNTEKVFKNGYYLPDDKLEALRKRHGKYERSEWQMEEYQDQPSDEGNYDWFAILADVRNGRGFAGIQTGDGFEVIAQPRGVPDDATQEWKDIVEQWDGDMHSHSWLTVDDFLNFNWNQVTTNYGVITLEQYKKLRNTRECPDSWSGSIAGPNIVTISEQQADIVLEGETIPYKPVRIFMFEEDEPVKYVSLTSGHDIYVHYSWPVHYRDWFQHKWEEYINPMIELKKKYEDVRLVFAFDN